MSTEQIAIVALSGVVLVLLGYLIGSRGRGRAQQTSPAALPPVTLPPGAEALAPAFAELRGQLGEVQGKLETLRESAVIEAQRRPMQDQAHEWLQHLSSTLLGSARAGAAGERIVAEVLGTFPAQWQLTDHRVRGKTVEFAIKLADGLVLPIDSKVVAQSDLDTLDQTDDPRARATLEKKIRSDMLSRTAEVRQYVDERTPGFAVAAVSDAAYRLSGPILSAAYNDNQALIVPYSLLGPFVLMVYEQHRRNGVSLDAATQAKALAEAENYIKRALDILNSRLGDALTRFRNSYEELAQELGRAGRAVESLRDATSEKVGV